jgi:hypothetical protein
MLRTSDPTVQSDINCLRRVQSLKSCLHIDGVLDFLQRSKSLTDWNAGSVTPYRLNNAVKGMPLGGYELYCIARHATTTVAHAYGPVQSTVMPTNPIMTVISNPNAPEAANSTG